jgi:adenine-specific DNA-methyltransferase
LIRGDGPVEVTSLLQTLPSAWADHAIASVYSVLMNGDRRKRLGAYFTPPPLVDHLVSRLREFGMNLASDKIRDAAAGGAAFLVPLARMKVKAWKAERASSAEIVRKLRSQLIGREIEHGLASLANALLRRMLIDELGVPRERVARLELVKHSDSLKAKSAARDRVDHEIGNPPFLRLRGDDDRLKRKIFVELQSGRLNLYAMFVRRALEEVPPGGLIGYVIPASFLGGPEFLRFRCRILQLAEVLAVDLIEERTGIFLGAIQDTCFLVLRRRKAELAQPDTIRAASGTLSQNGLFRHNGTAEIHPNGLPWRLPGIVPHQTATLEDWGYRATVGYLVANRQPERLHKRPAKGRFPMIWAKAIASGGTLDFKRGAAFKGWGWADAPEDAPYVVRTPCVAVQRTSARGQTRRLNASAVPAEFIAEHGGIIGENHVILLVPTRADAVTPEVLAEALNQPAVSAEVDRVCGSASISVRLLESIPLGKRRL